MLTGGFMCVVLCICVCVCVCARAYVQARVCHQIRFKRYVQLCNVSQEEGCLLSDCFSGLKESFILQLTPEGILCTFV